MKYNRKYAAVLSLLFIVNIIGNTACGNTSAETGHVSIADMAMENTPIINYTIPTFTPNVLVDQQGYAGDGEKQAIVKSREPVESFRLIDKESGEIVYRGKVKQPEYNEDLQLYIGTVDFRNIPAREAFIWNATGWGSRSLFPSRRGIMRNCLKHCAKGCMKAAGSAALQRMRS